MKWFFDNLFYRIYIAASKSTSDPSSLTQINMVVLLMFNLFPIYTFFTIYFVPEIGKDKMGDILMVGVPLLYVILHLVYLRKQKYLKVIEKFTGQSLKRRIIGSSVLWIYIFLTFYLFVQSVSYANP